MTADWKDPFAPSPINYGGKDGPTATQLSDANLLHRLEHTEIVDRRARLNPASVDERIRFGINKIHADLFAEAVRRGLRKTT